VVGWGWVGSSAVGVLPLASCPRGRPGVGGGAGCRVVVGLDGREDGGRAPSGRQALHAVVASWGGGGGVGGEVEEWGGWKPAGRRFTP
jgi:hypothetical protein